MDNRVHYRGWLWRPVGGRSARRFAKRVWNERGESTITTFNNREVLVHNGNLYAKDEQVGSRTITPEQVANRPTARRTFVKGRTMYAPTDAIIKRE